MGGVQKELKHLASPEKARMSQRFFKTGPGQYGEGDRFIGVTVPDVRKVAKQFRDLSFAELQTLLISPIHEDRLCALIILVDQFKRGNTKQQKNIFDFYRKQIGKGINNWDLIDTSCEHVIGAWVDAHSSNLLEQLAESSNLWKRRVAIVSTFYFIKRQNAAPTLTIAKILLNDSHDLIHKATGWMLREVGKRCGEKTLTDFLNQHAAQMPRTMLRYAIERLSEKKRRMYLAKRA